MAENPEGTQVIPLTVRVEDALLDTEKERGLRISTWNSEYRGDSSAVSYADVTNLRDAQASAESRGTTYNLNMVLPRMKGTRENPWAYDATVWVSAQVFAPSAEGPVVGSEAGWAMVSLRSLRDFVVRRKKTLPLQLKLRQSGLQGVYNKMNVRIISIPELFESSIQAWQFAPIPTREAWIRDLLPHHRQKLDEYVTTMIYPFTDEARLRGDYFAPSHEALTPLHAPLWNTNISVPQWMFWHQTGDRPTGRAVRALGAVFVNALDIVLQRHDWKGGKTDFVALVLKQTQNLESEEYDPRYTYACAVLCDVCCLFATQLYYKYDETYVPAQSSGPGGGWFSSKSWERLDVESFHDAARMLGGDCEDLASLIHRMFRWLQLGDPALRATAVDGRLRDTEAHRIHGGWRDEGLDALQRMTLWYISGGSIGSVTSARIKPGAGGKKPDLIINGDLDESLDIGGHMWNSMIPVTRAEELLARFDKHGRKPRLRPYYPRKEYPGWVKFMPYLVGEGTGSLYPLIMPLQTYMPDRDSKARARKIHQRRLTALQVIQFETRSLRRHQVQRWSGDVDPTPDRRPSYFYRRESNFFTDDFANNDIPHWFVTWARRAPRVPETATAAVAAIPGGAPDNRPTWGVDMRDKIMADSETFGDGKPNVALIMGPATTPEQMASFETRRKQLCPWKIPASSDAARADVQQRVFVHIPAFQRSVQDILGESGALARSLGSAEDFSSTRVNVVFMRDSFGDERERVGALEDLRRIAGKVLRADTVAEYVYDGAHSVRLSLWILDEVE